MGLARAARGEMPEVRLVAEAADAGAGPGAQGDAPLDEPGQDGRGLGKRVGGRLVVFRLEPAGEQLSDPGAGGGEDVRYVVVARWGVTLLACAATVVCRKLPRTVRRPRYSRPSGGCLRRLIRLAFVVLALSS